MAPTTIQYLCHIFLFFFVSLTLQVEEMEMIINEEGPNPCLSFYGLFSLPLGSQIDFTFTLTTCKGNSINGLLGMSHLTLLNLSPIFLSPEALPFPHLQTPKQNLRVYLRGRFWRGRLWRTKSIFKKIK